MTVARRKDGGKGKGGGREPSEFLEARMIGDHLKFASCWWRGGLLGKWASAEAALLHAVVEKALIDACLLWTQGAAKIRLFDCLDAWDFLLSKDRCGVYCELLGLEHEWVERIVRRWRKLRMGKTFTKAYGPAPMEHRVPEVTLME